MFTLTTLLFCAIIAPAINAPNGNYTEIPSTVNQPKNTGQVRTKRQFWETTTDRQYSNNDTREKQNEQQNINKQISVSYIYYDGSAQTPPPPPPRHWGEQDYYRRPPPPPHDWRYPRHPWPPHQYEDDYRRPNYSHDHRDDRQWPPPPPPDRRRSFDHRPPPRDHGPPPPDQQRSFNHRPPPPSYYDHGPPHHRPPPPPPYGRGPPHHDRGPPPPWARGPPHRRPPPPWDHRPPYRGPPHHGPPPPPHHGPPDFDRKPPQSYNEKKTFEDKRLPDHGSPPYIRPSSNNNSPDNIQTDSSNDQNEDFINNLKLVFSDEFKNTFLKNRQALSESNNENPTTVNAPDPEYKQERGEPLANLEHSTVHDNTTPPSLSHLFQVVPVTPDS